MSPTEDTPAARIEALRKSLPPREGRASRLGHLSKDDLADLLGAGRKTVILWTTGKSYPAPAYRIKLAGLSGGRYSPDDFAPPGQRAATDRREELEARVAELEELVNVAIPRIDQLAAQVEALSKQERPTRRKSGNVA